MYPRLFLMALCWSGTFIAGRYLMQSLSVYHTAFMRYLIAGAVLTAIVLYQREKLNFSFRQHIVMFFLGLTGITLYNLFFFKSLELINAGRVALITTSNPAFTSLFAFFLFRERINAMKIIGIALNIMGVLTIMTRGDFSMILNTPPSAGDLFAFLGLLSWVAYTLAGGAFLKHVNPLPAVFYASIYGFIQLLTVSAVQDDISGYFSLSLSDTAAVAYLAIFGTVIPFLWYYKGIQKIGTVNTVAFINLIPIFAVLESWLLLDELPDTTALIGGACVIIGIALVNRLDLVIKAHITK